MKNSSSSFNFNISSSELWKIGGKNVDEDPHFSSYYHRLSTDPDSEYFNYEQLIAFYKDFNEGYYIRKDIANKVAQTLLDKLLVDPVFFLRNDDEIRKCSDNILEYLDESEKVNIDEYETAKQLYFKISQLTLELYKYSRIPQCLDRSTNIFTDYLLKLLEKAGSKDIMRDFSILTTPIESTLFQEAEKERAKIKKYITENKPASNENPLVHQYYFTINNEARSMIEVYRKKYSHISYHGYGSRYEFSIKNFIDDLMKEDLQTEEFSEHGYYQENIIKSLHLSIKDQIVFMIYSRFGTTKMYRRFSQVRLFRLLDKVLMFFSIHWNLPEVLLRNLTYLELTEALNLNKHPEEIVPQLRERLSGSAFCYDNGNIEVRTGLEYQKIKSQLSISNNKQLLKGITAYHGNVLGIVRKVFRSDDLFLKDEILISESTDPDLSEKIKIAKCVLTEQGGATAHACIICRELKVPCVVGIDGLLESLNDGDMVEVNTLTGEIKKLNDFKFVQKLLDTKTNSTLGGKFDGLEKLNQMGYGRFVPLTFAVNFERLSDVNSVLHLEEELEIVCRIINKPLAIRSSASNEDSRDKSFAGQYKTILHVAPEVSEVVLALKEITSHAQNLQNVYNDDSIQLNFSLIIQPMFESAISGVIFSKNVITNNQDELYLEYCLGYGENIVSGKVKPNILRYSKSTMEILEHTKNFESTLFVEKQFSDLAKYSVQLSKKLNYDIDIEFGINSDNQIAIFQMRPITT